MGGNLAARALAVRHRDTADAGGAPARMGMRAQLRCIRRRRSSSQSEQPPYAPLFAAARSEVPTTSGGAKDPSTAGNRAETDSGRLDAGACARGATATSPRLMQPPSVMAPEWSAACQRVSLPHPLFTSANGALTSHNVRYKILKHDARL